MPHSKELKTKLRGYEDALKVAPPQDSPEFLQFIIEFTESHGRKIVWQNDDWLCVENALYHDPENGKPWFTIFHKHGNRDFWDNFNSLRFFARQYEDWEWVKRAVCRQRIKRVFFHVYMPDPTTCPIE